MMYDYTKIIREKKDVVDRVRDIERDVDKIRQYGILMLISIFCLVIMATYMAGIVAIDKKTETNYDPLNARFESIDGAITRAKEITE